ncbi:MAG: PTS lactose/cellobiose transporter subunit IIA [Liquorilactobacillus ghanensis]|uniref:PTS lactose/cellobiose transporter subunit IIA n=1 Tax=Liquorilactobacillus ghanensis TaxID=399370 RepID=UPI0039E8748B
MDEDKRMRVIMGLIMAGGNAKGSSVAAIQAAKQGDFAAAEKQLTAADQALTQAHNVQTEMLTKEAQGEKTPVDLYLVHAQDHLMTAIAFKDLAQEFVEVYQRMAVK